MSFNSSNQGSVFEQAKDRCAKVLASFGDELSFPEIKKLFSDLRSQKPYPAIDPRYNPFSPAFIKSSEGIYYKQDFFQEIMRAINRWGVVS